MELSADAVAAELRDHRQLPLLGVFPNGRADGVERNVWPASGQTREQTFLRNSVQVPGMKQLISCPSLCDTWSLRNLWVSCSSHSQNIPMFGLRCLSLLNFICKSKYWLKSRIVLKIWFGFALHLKMMVSTKTAISLKWLKVGSWNFICKQIIASMQLWMKFQVFSSVQVVSMVTQLICDNHVS